MPEPIKILHLEDNVADREFIRALLDDAGLPCSFAYAQTRTEFGQLLRERSWDLILADYSLPSFDGYAALGIAQRLAPNAPFIFVTGVMGEDVAVETLKRGATDYVLKRRLERLAPAVRRALFEADSKRRFRQVQEKLEFSEQRYRVLIDSIHQYAICMVDPSGFIVSWNAGAERMFGFSETEARGSEIALRFQDTDSASALFDSLVITAQQEGHAEAELFMTRKDGEPFCCHILLTPLCGPKPRVNGFVLIIEDVTHRKRLERELEEGRQERARMQDRFLSHISHELRTPIATIVDFASLLMEGVGGELLPEQTTYLSIVLQAARQLTDMVNNLLDLARSEWQRLPVHPECISLNSVVDETCRSLEPAASRSNVTLVCNIEPELPPVFADCARIREVLTNLIENALKYGATGGRVSVLVTRGDEPEFVRVSVEDEGPGIDSAHLERIFDRFYRVAEGPDTNPAGLGLGLYITRELVKAHGGDVHVSSTLGAGSVFQFTLPVFDLRRILFPILSPKNLSTGKLALIKVSLPATPDCSSDLGRYIRATRELLQRCTYATEDLILPQINIAGLQTSVCVIAFTNHDGARSIVDRIRRHLRGARALQPLDGDFEVSTTIIDFTPDGSSGPERIAAELDAQIRSCIGFDEPYGGKNDGKETQDPDHRRQSGAPDGDGHQVAASRL